MLVQVNLEEIDSTKTLLFLALTITLISVYLVTVTN